MIDEAPAGALRGAARPRPGERVVLTGATGALGPHVLDRLRARWPAARLVVLARDPGALKQRADVQAVRADLARPDLGTEASTALAESTAVIHMAADVRWNQPLANAMNVNADGTRRLVQRLAEARSLRRFVLVSTLYAEPPGHCAHCPPFMTEDGIEYNNSYEYSKRAAEQIVRESALPWSIVRPSLIVGAQADGCIGRYSGLYVLLAYAARGLLPFVIGRPEAWMDLVPVDVVAEATLAALIDPALKHRTVFACSADRAVSVSHVIQRAMGVLDAFRRTHDAPPVTPAAIIDCERYRRLYYPFIAPEVGSGERRLLAVLDAFHPYLSIPRRFTVPAGSALFQPPPFDSYVDVIVTRWCEANPAAATAAVHDWARSLRGSTAREAAR